MNLRLLGRGYRFRHAPRVLATLAGELRRRPFDRVIFSGDATALGFEEELDCVADLLGLHEADPLPGLAVPGNHDYNTRRAVRAGSFERTFAPWQKGERVDGEIYPFAQRVGHAWLVAVNSSTANRWPWDATGRVGRPQLDRLERLLGRLQGGPRVLVTHYPIVVANGRPERRVRALRDLDDLVAVAVRGGIGLWLHGHRHNRYHHSLTALAPFPVICAGSATQSKRWSYNEYELDGRRLRVVQRLYDDRAKGFHDAASFELDLSAPASLAPADEHVASR